MKNYYYKQIIIIATLFLATNSQAQVKVKTEQPKMQAVEIPEEVLTTKLTKEKITAHLKTFMNPSKPIRNAKINKTIENMQFEKMYIERVAPDVKVLIIPMKNVYFSQNIDLNKTKPLQYVLIFEKANEEISRADFMLIYPENKALKELPKNTFQDHYYDVKSQIDGIFTLINFGDVIQFELTIKNGKRVKARTWESKKNENSNRIDDCKEWTLVTQLMSYEGEGSIKSDRQPLGKTCTECPPGSVCDAIKK